MLSVAAYSDTLQVPFVFDDDPNIRDNALIRLTELDPDRLYTAAFRSPMRRRPVPNLSFALNYYFGRYDVTGYHAVNLAVHCVNGILVYLLGLHLFGRLAGRTGPSSSSVPVAAAALLAAAVFALHPVQTQSVTYIVQRMTSMAAMFYLAAFLFYIHGREHPAGWVRLSAWGTAALFWGFALASKEISVTLPAAVFLYEWYFFRDLSIAWIRRVTPYLLGASALMVAAAWYEFGASPFDFSGRDFTMWQRLLTQFRVLVFYISLLLYPLPRRLNLTHDFPISTSLCDPFSTLLCFLALLSLFGVAVWTAGKKPLLSFCVLWFFLHLAIESSVVHLELVFEHRLYLPMVGFALLIGHTIFRALPVPQAAALAIAGCAVLGGATYQRNEAWSDLVTLWSDVVAKSPHDARAHMSLGSALEQHDRLDESLAHLRQALELDPNYAEAHYDVGVVLSKQGKYEEAVHHLTTALHLEPGFGRAHAALGVALASQGHSAQALFHLEEAVRLEPTRSANHHDLGVALARQGRTEEAIECLTESVRLDPESIQARRSLVTLLIQQGRCDEAIPHLRAALRLRANDATLHNELGIALADQNRFDEAIDHFSEALRIDPSLTAAAENRDAALRMKALGGGRAP